MKKALVTASVASMVYRFNMDNICIMVDLGYDVEIACNFGHENPMKPCEVQEFELKLSALDIIYYKTNCPRSILRINKISNTYNQYKEIYKTNYDLIHCHSPIGGVLARLAARKSRKSGTKVIYTAHGFHFFKGAPLINWLIYYPIEKICSYFTDVLITINKEDYVLAQKTMHAKKVCYIPGVGIDTQKFANVVVNRDEKRAELGVSPDEFMLLSVGEINKNKNHEVIIKAIAKLKNPKLQYFIAGKGDLSEQLHKLADLLSVSGQVHFLGYRNDVVELYKSADVFCFPSHREGLGLAALEAMSSGLPIVTSNIHGIVDYSVNEETGFSCNPNDVCGFADAINNLYGNLKLRKSMGEHNTKVVEKFHIKNVNKIMRGIYGDIGNE